MNIKHPEFIFLLLLLPALYYFGLFVFHKRQKLLASFFINFSFISKTRYQIRLLCLFLTFAMIIFALISPRWSYEWTETRSNGSNIILALDLSKSMMARDIEPSRLSRAKLEINKLIEKLSQDRLGLIIFGEEAFLQTPLTHDYLMIQDWLSQIDSNSISSSGTSIKSAIEAAIKAFSFFKSENKNLIIISDGEEQDTETLEAASRAFAQGIKIYTIGVGTKQGAPISTIEGPQISKLDDILLKAIAYRGHGLYVKASNGDFHLNQLYFDAIKKNKKSENLKSGKSKQWHETYQIFLLIAFIALIIDFFLSINLGLWKK